ncbi:MULTISPECIES: hypothetical protein [Salinibaculum]|uniref:hypothetical protein n=1 Tax=Salinibaculum TaxID=2732368 RepID=UPI0030D51DF2
MDFRKVLAAVGFVVVVDRAIRLLAGELTRETLFAPLWPGFATSHPVIFAWIGIICALVLTEAFIAPALQIEDS